MKGLSRLSVAWLLAGVPVLAIFVGPQLCYGNVYLAVRLAGGQGRAYELATVERLVPDGSSMLVVAPIGSDAYPLESVVRLDFGVGAATSIEVPEHSDQVVQTLWLSQNQPNPFSVGTRVDFELPRSGQVKLMIYSADGRIVRRLVDEQRPSGRYVVDWDGRDENGQPVSSGVYFCRLSAPDVDEGRKMLVLR